ncbi:MAG: HAD family hydrolase [Candidatus Thorarchaeota archaeon]|nr:HAD family hydrolase [Candidatus Thorarchaeota archaeon]
MSEFRLERYNAILFDLDSTILDTGIYAVDASKWILRQSTNKWTEILEDFIAVLVETYHNEISKIASGGKFKRPIDCVRDALIVSLKEFHIEPVDEILRNGLDMFREFHIEYASPTDGLRDIIDSLNKKGIELGVITNSFQGNAKRILSNLNLDHYFSVIADSSDYNAFKPMPDPFEFALAKLGVSETNTLYIGDEFYADVVGAIRAGLAVVWINNREDVLEENLREYGVEPTFVINSFSELKELI